MPKPYSSKNIISVLKKNKFVYISQKGSHIKYRKYGSPVLTVIIPANRREIPFGTFRSILRQSRFQEIDFE